MTAARPYREGEQVRLKEGGTLMTVVVASENLVFCEWHEGGGKQHQVFRLAQVESAGPPPQQAQQPQAPREPEA